VAVQADCERSTYFNHAFQTCAETHYSFDLGYPVHVYAPKDSDHGRRLYELLKDGSKRRFTLRIQRIGPAGQPLPVKDDSCFALLGIVQAQK
jgi:hypothetical protein